MLMGGRPELAEAIARARDALIPTLESLGEDDWDTPSLCEGWTVRDVVGHLVHQHDIYRAPHRLLSLIRVGGRVNRWLAEEARLLASKRTNAELIDDMRSAEFEKTIYWRTTPWPQFALTELVVHSQDIRRPLGIAQAPSMTHLVTAADVLAGPSGFNPLRRVFQGRLPPTRFEATDHSWSHGDGPLARGPLEAIVMVLSGRPEALGDLSGDGVAQLEHALS
jgi:uncharacterized protein (TIGR03083 family)